jgi:hypothetical protein
MIQVFQEVEQVDFVLAHQFSVCGATPYSITVGGGGAAGSAWPAGVGVSGSNSVFGPITSTGGGGGGGRTSSPVTANDGKPGGSGGGASTYVQVQLEVEQVILRQ